MGGGLGVEAGLLDDVLDQRGDERGDGHLGRGPADHVDRPGLRAGCEEVLGRELLAGRGRARVGDAGVREALERVHDAGPDVSFEALVGADQLGEGVAPLAEDRDRRLGVGLVQVEVADPASTGKSKEAPG